MRKSSYMIGPKGIATMAMLTLFSCSIPFFGKGQVAIVEDQGKKDAQVTGVLEYREGCDAGYYKVVLKGLFENAGIEIETQSDSTGRFIVTAPPGRYLAQAMKGECGVKESIELERNTEHMYSFVVQEFKELEKFSESVPSFPSRLPASVLVPVNK